MKPVYFILLIGVFFTTACLTDRYINIVQNTPPEITLDSLKSIIVINSYNFNQLGLKSDKKLAVLKYGAFASINYAVNKLKGLPGITVITLDDSARLYTDPDSLKIMAKKHGADYVLALNQFSAFFDADNFQAHTDYNNNKKETIKTADYSMKVITNYVLYDQNGKVLKNLEGFTSDYKTTREVPGVLLVGFWSPWIKNNSLMVNGSAIKATENALSKFFPFTAVKSRPLYYNSDLEDAVNEITANNYNRADSLLKPFLKSGDVKLAAKAAYNLAVVYEAKGDLKAAVDMAHLSLEKKDNIKARNLISDLDTTLSVTP